MAGMCKNPTATCREYGECCGPCYDLCACRHCWRGWSGVSFRSRLYWRIRYIIAGGDFG